ncbi:hypothetical protein [Streptomyces formicae]|uniref:Ig-like domain-containing protein n=1 Tax=Streptomyces formicae TaxID=1616117 RepID=A0ABY3WP19_9ACTN|nr:hypothetical protein [Streptomyces formicae]UNM13331.1 hypothetical protein J4032_19200 [Streptomyces formicae]
MSERIEDDDEYSATALADHWGELPAPPEHHRAVPDRVEGAVLRFGPGVTAAVRTRQGHENGTTAAVAHDAFPGRTPPPPGHPAQRHASRLAGLRRYTLAAVVLLAVLGTLAWDRYGPGVGVRSVSVRTDPAGPGCDGTAEITALVGTDGRPGTLTYRWVRNDGTASDELTERLTRGQRQARLRLLWTFHGEGAYDARAELRITTPTRHRAAAGFTYTCA